ncbi:hypothetical protein PMI08_01573 [Brevibacillus sp. CF112]|uniref:XkdQ/YqbQ family protein n=1 Tax=Brevibacillus TaxID=55080 RepID=UPI000271D470|nr:hypothetical protein [Brevibacillus sp. CF112]EJL45688.1 hypothetical protein PMI08_01573 [Brevibacillus sp. CF112]
MSNSGLDVQINGQSLKELLVAPPKINDQANAVCRTLEIKLVGADGLHVPLGKQAHLWYGGKRWFMGFAMKREFNSDGTISILAYDPLFFMKRHKDDWLFKNMTGSGIFSFLAGKVGIAAGPMDSTPVLPTLHYEAAPADQVGVDILARLYQLTGKKYWYRFDPEKGLIFFERKLPQKAWAFQTGINLTKASYAESAEATVTGIKLVNRETGKIVLKTDTAASKEYGYRQDMQEVDKDKAKTMDALAAQMLKDLAKLDVTMNVEGINPNAIMPQLFSGDVIYVEEDFTQIIGGYFIKDITHTFASDNLVQIGMSVTEAPEVPKVQYEKATENPSSKGKKKNKGGSGKKKEEASTPGVYTNEMKKVMERYGQ